MKSGDMILILASVGLSAAAQFALKLGATMPQVREAISGNVALADRALALVTAPMLMLGLFMYGISAAFWIAVLSRLDLSLAYPFVGLGFVFTFVAGVVFLGEGVTVARLIGTVMIALGAVMVARSA